VRSAPKVAHKHRRSFLSLSLALFYQWRDVVRLCPLGKGLGDPNGARPRRTRRRSLQALDDAVAEEHLRRKMGRRRVIWRVQVLMHVSAAVGRDASQLLRCLRTWDFRKTRGAS